MDGGAISLLTSSSPDLPRGHLIHNMAPEILGEIFIRCLPNPPKLVSSKNAPLLLLQVCRHWRQTARWTPRLWTELKLSQKAILQPARFLQIWLDNAGSLPLKVTLPGHAKYPKEAEEVIELLLDHFHRISELDGSLTPSFASILLRCSQSFPIRAPFLKRLDVGCWDKLPSILDLERLRGCIIAPQLEVCNLNTSRFQLSLLRLDPTRLRELCDLWVIEVAEFESMEILISFTSLQTLTIFLQPALDVSVLKIPSIIPIPSLRRLQIATYPGYDPNLFPKALDVAFIECLELCSVQPGDLPLGPMLDSLTGGIIPPLKSLRLSGYNITASECMPWIRRFTELETLTLEDGTFDLEALNLFSCGDSLKPSDFWICPHLSTLHLKRFKAPWNAMEDLVRSRAPTGDVGGRLRKVIFEASEGLGDLQKATFKTIQEDSRGWIQFEFLPGWVRYDYTCFIRSNLHRVEKTIWLLIWA